ncbi:extracellular solute-binding protein [Nocardiopsis sp. L17-MgMaSL7]|uniref:extracellular solute-binding protein n=1 Tax=Nocardiopsis sp. L17-MgMaSL7 TaxID=1938893 RepID=UPI000D71761C|nr:extracellular solute-binding protein [Nocardiopsis sp. L17-MgMaSL7]PWV58133.1 carbohydrate ABC transporter substrate-binding protein (CUT1 family) [Nocardiopsis sp. L17-MgMaSL7]
MRRIRRNTIRAAVAVPLLALVASGCSTAADRDEDTVRVVYQKFGTFIAMDSLMRQVKEEFEDANPGVTVELHAIEAQAEDYQTQVNLMNGSPSEAPDLIYQDTFTINQDADAGYLMPLDDHFDAWDERDQYSDQEAVAVTSLDGQRYGVMLGTDVRGLWYNTELLEQAGIDTPWAPTTWDDVLDTARTIRAELGDDVVPLNVYSGTPAGEMASLQGFQMLLSGTEGALFDDESEQWVTGSTGFTDSLDFLRTLYDEDLTLDPQDALDANVGTVNNEERIPSGGMAISLEGSWATQSWIEEANQPWPEWEEVMDFAPMPTQNGQGAGATSMSGGWALSMGANATDPDLAWEVMTYALNQENGVKFAVEGGQIPVRADVAEDPAFLEDSPKAEEFAALVDITGFRPAYSEYPRISLAVQEAMESVMLEQATPEEAAQVYAEEVEGVVGPDNVTTGS